MHKSGTQSDTVRGSNHGSDISGESGTLRILGISTSGEVVYESLIERSGQTLTDLEVSSGLSRAKLKTELGALERKGLVTYSANRPRRFFPTPPDVALEALIVKQQEALQRVRLTASRLHDKARSSGQSRETEHHLVEIISGRQAQIEIFDQIQRGAHEEIISFDRPPYVVAASGINTTELDMLKSGVSYRGVYDRGALMLAGASERIRHCIEAGEKARVFGKLPLKFVAADHRIALLPLDLQYLNGPALLVRESSLLDALYELFEALWDRASPISFDASGIASGDRQGTESLERHEALVALLASGLNDKFIAQQLDVSPRTLDRRIHELMASLDARTRFQMGWMIGLRASRTEGDKRD